MHKKVFIIGNGFDLDLGWKTSYKDFVCSDYWPLKDKEPSVKSNFFFNNFKKFSFQQISAFCIQHKVGHFCYSL